MAEPPYHLEVSGLDDGESDQTHGASPPARPWVGIRFDCCNVYTRVYRNQEGTSYLGYCPRCLRRVKLRVGSGGTSSRFFIAE